MKRAVITGATGAIGVALVKELIKNDVEVLVILRKNSDRNNNIPNHPLVTRLYCDLENIGECENTTNKEFDVFYHFAWAGTTGNARNDVYLQNRNVKYSLDAVKCAARFGCKRFVGAGSQAEYGRVNEPLKPDTPTFPENGYGMAKLCAGMMTGLFCRKNNMEHVWVRVLSVYGPCDGKNSMVMSTIDKLKNGVTPNLTKGEQVWDYLHSLDAARAFYLVGEYGKDGKTYVLGSGKARRLKEYIEDIKNAINPNVSINYGAVPYSENQVMHLEADIGDLTEDTWFRPSVEFAEGIANLMKEDFQ